MFGHIVFCHIKHKHDQTGWWFRVTCHGKIKNMQSINTILIYTDGGARGNPGQAAIGVVIKSETNTSLTQISERIGEATNNVAEYKAIIAALSWIKEHAKDLGKLSTMQKHFFSDSTLVVNQLNGLFKLKDAKLRELYVNVKILEAEVGGNVLFTSIPREKNIQADRLVNMALDHIPLSPPS